MSHTHLIWTIIYIFSPLLAASNMRLYHFLTFHQRPILSSFLQNMSSMITSQGAVFATAMAVSGTVIILALRLQKSQFSLHHVSSSSSSSTPILRSCLSSGKLLFTTHIEQTRFFSF
jgi:hypothetical protein